MKSVFIPCLAIFLATSPVSQAQEKVTLKLNLQPGSSYTYTMDMNQTNVQTVQGEDQKLVQEMLMVWDYDVIEKGKDNVATVKLTYRRVKIKQDYGHQVADYDSDNPPGFVDPSMRGLASLPGNELIVRLTSMGNVIDIQGVDKMLDKLITSLDLPDSPQKDQVVANLRKQFGVDAVKQSMEQITSFYPDKQVAVGSKWSNTTDASSGFPMEIVSEYTLQSRKGGQAIIDVSSKLTSDPKDPMAMGPLTMAYDVTGSQTGSIVVDEKSGLPAKSEMSLQFSGNVNVSGVPNEAPQSWPISANGSVVVSFEKQAD
jgi:predicted secreted protein